MAAGEVSLDGSLGLEDLLASLTAIPGIGTTAANQIALRLGHQDAFPESDPLIGQALRRLDYHEPANGIASRWKPWRAVAATHLVAHASTIA
jgi:AraC family transcriptional regulator of adaptative response / DNA-3-methyladenine glycosylase II